MVLSPVVRGAATGVLMSVIAVCGGAACTAHASGSTLITLDGSSTVFPISEAVAEEFQKSDPGARVTVGISGTGGGFQKFCRAETDISDASRPITPPEIELCAKAGVEYIDLPIAFDGIAIAVNPKASWVSDITVAELNKIWAADSEGKVMRWSQVRGGWPDRELHLFGAGVDSGTYDYFTQVINGEARVSRGDFTSSEDDNVLVQGISGDEGALGFVPFAYFEDNQDKLKLLPVDDGKADNGAGPIAPSAETIAGGQYAPLSRPVFIYVSKKASARPEVQRFVEFYLDHAAELATEVNYVRLGETAYVDARSRFAREHLH